MPISVIDCSIENALASNLRNNLRAVVASGALYGCEDFDRPHRVYRESFHDVLILSMNFRCDVMGLISSISDGKTLGNE